MIRKWLILTVFVFEFATLFGQTIRRPKGHEVFAIQSQVVARTLATDFFEKYIETAPEFGGSPLKFDEGIAKFNWGGEVLRFSKVDQGKLKLELPNGNVLVADSIRDTKHYCGHRPHKMVISSGADFATMKTTYSFNPSGAAGGYNSSPQRPTPIVTSSSHWETIPGSGRESVHAGALLPSTYYVFQINDQQKLIAYLRHSGGILGDSIIKGEYFMIQNPTCIKSKLSDGRTLLVLDTDANGSYDDDKDQVLVLGIPSNDKHPTPSSWHSHYDLRNKSFITLEIADDKIVIESPQGSYYGSKERGNISIKGMPENGMLFMNGEEVANPKNGKPISAEFGYYRYLFAVPGRMDSRGEVIVNAKNMAPSIAYEETGPAVWVRILPGYWTDFSVSIQNPAGEPRICQSPDHLDLMPGKNVVVFKDLKWGSELKRTFDVEIGDEIELDIRKELTIDLLEGMKAKGQTGPEYKYMWDYYEKTWPQK